MEATVKVLSPEAKILLAHLEAHNKGRDHAARRAFLSIQTGINPRSLRLACEELREAGYPVLYSTDKDGGIFLAETEKEIEEGLVKLENLAMSILSEKAALRRALERMREGKVQATLFEIKETGQRKQMWI